MVAGELPRAITRATRWQVSCLPPEHEEAHVFTLSVEQHADATGFRWLVTANGASCYDAEGNVSYGVRWPERGGREYEPETDEELDDYSRRYDAWMDAHRFTEAEALALARRLAPRMTYRGRTVADALGEMKREIPFPAPESAPEAPKASGVILWTGKNLEAVQSFLGTAYDRVENGGLLRFWCLPKLPNDGLTRIVFDSAEPGQAVERYIHPRDGIAYRKMRA